MSFKFIVKTTPAHLEIPDSARAKASERMMRANLAQIDAKLDARGQPLPSGVDLKNTGAMVGSARYDARGYSFNVDYAEHVEARFHFVGVAPNGQQRAEEEISSIWDQEPLEIIED